MSASVWRIRKLGTVASMHARIGWQNLRTTEFLDSGDYYLITGTDFEDGHVNFDTCHYVEKDRFDQDANIQIQIGSILITKDGTLGKVAYIDKLNKPATLNAGVFNVVVRDEQTDEKYLFHLLKSSALMNYAAIKSTGGTIKHLNQNVLVKFPVVLPEKKSEQKRISDILSTCDTVIQKTQKTIDKYKAIKQGMMQDLFTRGLTKDGKLRPSFKDAPELYKESELGMIPKEWEVKELNDIFLKVKNAFVGTATPYYVEQGHFYLESNNVKNGFINFNNKIYINDYFYQKQKSNWLHTGDLVMVQSGHVGHTAVIPEYLNNTAAHAVIIIANSKIPADSYFYNYYFFSENAVNMISKITKGNTIKHILSSEMRSFKVTYPKIEEQTAIASRLSSIDSAIQKEEAILEKYKNIKTGLMARLLTPPEDAEIIDETGE